jgi:hypothetical protein
MPKQYKICVAHFVLFDNLVDVLTQKTARENSS